MVRAAQWRKDCKYKVGVPLLVKVYPVEPRWGAQGMGAYLDYRQDVYPGLPNTERPLQPQPALPAPRKEKKKSRSWWRRPEEEKEDETYEERERNDQMEEQEERMRHWEESCSDEDSDDDGSCRHMAAMNRRFMKTRS